LLRRRGFGRHRPTTGQLAPAGQDAQAGRTGSGEIGLRPWPVVPAATRCQVSSRPLRGCRARCPPAPCASLFQQAAQAAAAWPSGLPASAAMRRAPNRATFEGHGGQINQQRRATLGPFGAPFQMPRQGQQQGRSREQGCSFLGAFGDQLGPGWGGDATSARTQPSPRGSAHLSRSGRPWRSACSCHTAGTFSRTTGLIAVGVVFPYLGWLLKPLLGSIWERRA